MTARTLIMLTTALLFAGLAHAADDRGYRIDQVTVFPDRAEIVRVMDVRLAAGEGELRIGDLPARLLNDSIRVAVRSGEGVALGGMELRPVRGADRVTPRGRDLESRIRTLELRIQGLDNRIEARELQLRLLESVAAQDAGQDSAARLEALEQIGLRAEEVLAQRLAHQSERAEQVRELERLQRELADLGRAQRDMRELRISVRSEQEISAEIEVSYVATLAGWESLYEWRLDTETSRLVLVQRAQVRQDTGEDWADARIRFALGQPAMGGQLPELDAWYVDIVDPVARRQAMESMAMDVAVGFSPQQAELAGSEMAAAFDIPGRNSVSSDNTPHHFTLAQHEMSVALSARAVPRRQARAWLYAEGEYAGEAWLPPGRVSLFQDGAVVGQTRFAGLAPGGSLASSFGVAERIEISRELVRDTRGSEGVVRRANRVEREYQFEVSNRYSRPLEVLIIDQMPIARDERIQIELASGSRSPDISDFNNEPGVVAWKSELRAGQTERFRFGYRAVFPRDIEDLSGW